MQDLNLAGLAFVAMLTLFFPASGLLARRRRRINERKLMEDAQMRRLIREVVERDNERQREKISQC
jgi:hypothetical protein